MLKSHVSKAPVCSVRPRPGDDARRGEVQPSPWHQLTLITGQVSGQPSWWLQWLHHPTLHLSRQQELILGCGLAAEVRSCLRPPRLARRRHTEPVRPEDAFPALIHLRRPAYTGLWGILGWRPGACWMLLFKTLVRRIPMHCWPDVMAPRSANDFTTLRLHGPCEQPGKQGLTKNYLETKPWHFS